MSTMVSQLAGLVESGFGRPKVLVVGDLMLDQYVWGEVERISPEAPVPVLRSSRQSQHPGGAANVAMNLAGMGAQVSIAGFGGEDDAQRALDKLLTDVGVAVSIIGVPGASTTTKLRVLAGHQQLLRIDNDPVPTECNRAAQKLVEVATALLASASVLVLSDYAKGTLNERTCRTLIAEARRRHVPIVVDPKGSDFTRYHGATTMCPNAKELAAVTGENASDLKWLLSAGQKMVSALDLKHMLVTLGEKGIAIVRQDSVSRVPAASRQVFDVSGAGDTVTSIVALSLASGLPIEQAVELANLAAGIVIGKVGTVPIQRNELLGVLESPKTAESEEKVVSLESLLSGVVVWRSRGDRIVFTNGCFDLLHAGHISLLEQAKRMGDKLIVGINSDRSVRRLKGRRRPLVGEKDRARVLAALAAVDSVVVFDEATPIRLIETLRPDVLVKGGDYTEPNVVGAAEVKRWGGRLELVPLIEGCSTTSIVERSLETMSLGVDI